MVDKVNMSLADIIKRSKRGRGASNRGGRGRIGGRNFGNLNRRSATAWGSPRTNTIAGAPLRPRRSANLRSPYNRGVSASVFETKSSPSILVGVIFNPNLN